MLSVSCGLESTVEGCMGIGQVMKGGVRGVEGRRKRRRGVGGGSGRGCCGCGGVYVHGERISLGGALGYNQHLRNPHCRSTAYSNFDQICPTLGYSIRGLLDSPLGEIQHVRNCLRGKCNTCAILLGRSATDVAFCRRETRHLPGGNPPLLHFPPM